MYYAEHIVFRKFRLFLHCCELHVLPWLFGKQLTTVCMSPYGPSGPVYRVYSVCTHQPKPIWAWNAVAFHGDQDSTALVSTPYLQFF